MDIALCQNPNHDSQRLKYICVDPNCNVAKRIGCADCFLDDHITHIRKTTAQFKEQVSQSIDTISQVEFSKANSSPQKDLDCQIDFELENCIENIKSRFLAIKNDLKSQIDSDMLKVQDNCSQFKQNMNNELNPFKLTIENELPSLNQYELNQLVKFYQEAPKIHKHYSKASELLQDEKSKVKQKKQKHLNKMKSIIQVLLKEFNDLMTTKNVQIDDCSEYETPQKYTMSPNKMINLVETARSTRRFPMSQSQKKYFLSAVTKKLD
ncbi:unnamed protein product (macronuclear) [Paramecium tetraurelia]|uniref:B box-type domain-containing protein n=1 Tax=Paramecium tetraurelia TaxID=5888 RepID=A0DI14_PARTE|nr:uncharacterized protein GSPATT00017052001 [Paramecium tetraurelia]CAK82681.1 unnamed protein product [Paramecium tetraurelia]|eukprot:XP_001450078.1 hypothetical protein (macronuclear) [Paramecium tetraurelia strain d4-2]